LSAIQNKFVFIFIAETEYLRRSQR